MNHFLSIYYSHEAMQTVLFAWLSFILEDNKMKEKRIRCLKVEPGKVPEECTFSTSDVSVK